ncbi:MAG: type IV toxin-antitoxin system AbiEi family antitoxin domain-containing protein [Actinobacteria bacterium]|nr:type IV toxin-antitoxin system AbiEi family antitoxin domain-containing protein [Actinomycetota bacterium]
MTSTRTTRRRTLDALAFEQAGYFSAAQAVAAGYSYQAQKYHVDAGNWVRVDRGIFRLRGWPLGSEDVYVRWTLWSGGRGVVSHDSALAVHGLSDVDPAKLHLTVPPGFFAVDDLIVLHAGYVSENDLESRHAWVVTTPLRSLLDAAGSTASQEQLDRAVSDALRIGLVTRRRVLQATSNATDRVALRLERALARNS